ncbi:MAG: zinc ribbon domain-containing protein [Acidobacteriota bacterium]|nr:zinc ribbon domain-containing protein [Acidobacteriota bacterium]
MPLYEYQCAKCGKKSEFIQRFGDPHETKCPHCGGALKKLLSSPAVQFKGSGFYATDYAKSGSRSEESKGEKSEKSEEKKDSSKGEEGKSGGEGGSESKGDSAAGEGKKEGDSSKGKKESGGDSGAAPASPAGQSPPAPSKKKKSERK